MLATLRVPEQLDSDLRTALRASVVRCGTLIEQALHVASTAIVHAPTLDDRIGAVERARELLLQLEHATAFYRDVSSTDLLEHTKRLLPQTTPPATWLEVATAQLLIALATQVSLDHQLQLTGSSSEATLFARACQAEHYNAARAALEELAAGSAKQRAELRSGLDRWLSLIVPVLGDDTLRSKYSFELERVSRELDLAG